MYTCALWPNNKRFALFHRRWLLRCRLRLLPAEGPAGLYVEPSTAGLVKCQGKEALTPGKHVLEFDWKYGGPGLGKGGSGT